MNPSKKILILYTEIAGYTLACLDRFNRDFPDAEILLVHYPVNPEAPFQFSASENFRTISRNSLDKAALRKLASEFAPDLLLVSGWIDKDYISVAKDLSGKTPTVLLMDNKWEGNLKQQVASMVASATVVRNFSHAWVPGEAQKKFAMKLGFPEKNIRTGFYSADTDHFLRIGDRLKEERKKQFPKRFIYAARYYEFKGLNELLEAFGRLRNETGTNWELWCAGTGSIVPPQIEGVKHFGFVQPGKMEELMKETSVFILPSKIEPWSVAVHEFACAGFPLLLSDKVGAGESFLVDGENGYSFKAGSADEIFNVLKKIIALDEEQLGRMGEKSLELAGRVTTSTWASTLNDLLQTKIN